MLKIKFTAVSVAYISPIGQVHSFPAGESLHLKAQVAMSVSVGYLC